MTDETKPDPKSPDGDAPDPSMAPTQPAEPTEPPRPTNYGHMVIASEPAPETRITLSEQGDGGKDETSDSTGKE